MLVPILLFVLGLVLLIKGGDWFVDGSVGIAHRLNVPDLLIGATVVAIGTTLPEVMVSATSAFEGVSDIAYGNAIGSVICNTALISALTIAVSPSEVDGKTFKTPVIFFFIAAVFYAVIAYTSGYFSRMAGIILLAMFVVYIILSVMQAKRSTVSPAAAEEAAAAEDASVLKLCLLLVVGAALIALGAKLLVDNGTLIAEFLGVPDSVIALTFVALGTSLPELVTAITSLVKGHATLSLGNIVGANLFNLVLVSGMAVTISPFGVPVEKTVAGLNASLVVDIPLMFFVMAFMTLPALKTGKLARYQGIILLALYAAFCVFQFAA